ncbi:PH domain-containing protein [Histoplasma capsulatum var. duboisii H88]|uniref:PH domain-containing protein n=1 Tax=Ajellomyces capsulatus (strain H88) TaxID=544711 RepID=F0UTL1_AJEC8|nr:PH domain-containing protein [Histoplasma capsulatum var. duboisii H88]
MGLANLPQRSATVKTVATTNTVKSDDEVLLDGDMCDISELMFRRLLAWKHVCGHLENYINATHKAQRTLAKEFEKVLKAVPEPLEEAAQFSEGKGGVVGLFDNIRINITAIVNLHLDIEKKVKTIALPTLERLHTEIKSKAKELQHGSEKGTKQVEKARSAAQKHIEMLGKYTAAFASGTGGKLEPAHDPYVLKRGTVYRMSKVVTEENNYRTEMLHLQESLAAFEPHIMRTVKDALFQLSDCMGAQSGIPGKMYANIAQVAQQIPADFEWMDFTVRSEASLINSAVPPLNIDDVAFPNQDHVATIALIEGTLERKSRAMIKGYNAGYYVVSPAGYLHGFKENDNYSHDPIPDITLYLPECAVGNADGVKFTVKGKDVSGGKVGQTFATTSELSFKAPSKDIARQWLDVLTGMINRSGSAAASQTTSPAVSRTVSGAHGVPPPVAHPAAGSTEAPSPPTSGQEEGFVAVAGGEVEEPEAAPPDNKVVTPTAAPLEDAASLTFCHAAN